MSSRVKIQSDERNKINVAVKGGKKAEWQPPKKQISGFGDKATSDSISESILDFFVGEGEKSKRQFAIEAFGDAIKKLLDRQAPPVSVAVLVDYLQELDPSKKQVTLLCGKIGLLDIPKSTPAIFNAIRKHAAARQAVAIRST